MSKRLVPRGDRASEQVGSSVTSVIARLVGGRRAAYTCVAGVAALLLAVVAMAAPASTSALAGVANGTNQFGTRPAGYPIVTVVGGHTFVTDNAPITYSGGLTGTVDSWAYLMINNSTGLFSGFGYETCSGGCTIGGRTGGFDAIFTLSGSGPNFRRVETLSGTGGLAGLVARGPFEGSLATGLGTYSYAYRFNQ